MKIRFLRNASYPQNDKSQSREYKEGQVYDVDIDHARRWIRRSAAVEVEDSKPETKEPVKAEAKADDKPEPETKHRKTDK